MMSSIAGVKLPYTKEDDIAMIAFVAKCIRENSKFAEVPCGKKVWERAWQLKVTQHSADSMQSRFSRYLRKNLSSLSYINEEDLKIVIKALGADITEASSNSIENLKMPKPRRYAPLKDPSVTNKFNHVNTNDIYVSNRTSTPASTLNTHYDLPSHTFHASMLPTLNRRTGPTLSHVDEQKSFHENQQSTTAVASELLLNSSLIDETVVTDPAIMMMNTHHLHENDTTLQSIINYDHFTEALDNSVNVNSTLLPENLTGKAKPNVPVSRASFTKPAPRITYNQSNRIQIGSSANYNDNTLLSEIHSLYNCNDSSSTMVSSQTKHFSYLVNQNSMQSKVQYSKWNKDIALPVNKSESDVTEIDVKVATLEEMSPRALSEQMTFFVEISNKTLDEISTTMSLNKQSHQTPKSNKFISVGVQTADQISDVNDKAFELEHGIYMPPGTVTIESSNIWCSFCFYVLKHQLVPNTVELAEKFWQLAIKNFNIMTDQNML